MAEATLTVNAFKQSLKGRVLSIKLSDSSAAPEPNIPKPSGESPQDELEEELEALMDEDDI